MEDIPEIVDYSGIYNTDSTISIIPSEILSHIFAILPLADRKSVRLVSRLWYDSSTCVPISKMEKFVFRTSSSIVDVNEVILHSNYPLVNLELQSLPVSDLHVDLWRMRGQRIRTLEFFNCQWHHEIISNIILHCENLTSFIIRTLPRYADESTLLRILCSEPLLDDLMKKEIRRPKLHTLLISIGNMRLPECVLHKIFTLYPNIKHFNTATVSFEASFTCSPMSHFVESPVFCRLYRCLNSVPQSEISVWNTPVPTNIPWMETLIKEAEQGLRSVHIMYNFARLKQFFSTLIYGSRIKYTIFDFFKSQRNLEVIRLTIVKKDDEDEPTNTGLFFHILESCPNLKEYCFRTRPYKVYFKPSELPRFVASISKLKFLSLNFGVFNNPAVATYHNLLSNSVHLNLTSLEWDNSSIVSDDFFAAFIQLCSSLRHLKLSCTCCDATLRSIFQYLVELRTLVLHVCEKTCNGFGFTGHVNEEEKGYSIKRLRQLKYFYLESCPFADNFMEKLALELHLTHLEFLFMNRGFYLQLSEDDSSHLASHLPKLRVLAIKQVCDECSMDKTIQFCAQFENLHRLICFEENVIDIDGGFAEINESEIDERLVEGLFNACPRLKYISDCKYSTFLRNPFTGRVVCEYTRGLNFSGNIFESELSS